MKELERTNEDLHQEIDERDKDIDTLKIQMQEMQERHGKQIRNLQSIHNQELEAKDREISRLPVRYPLVKPLLEKTERSCSLL